MRVFLTAILMLCATAAFAQTNKFRWTDELCEFEGVYDQKKYTQAQIKNTYKFLEPGNFDIETSATVWKYEEIKALDVAELDREYESKTKKLKNLDIAKTKFWESFRTRKLKEMKDVYELSRLTMLGYSEPAKLREAAFAETCVVKYAVPLINGGDELLSVWRDVNETTRLKNADPERIKKIFEAEFDSPDRLKFARVEVMAFGFWNCANALLERIDADATPEEEFKKLFVQVETLDCDEP